MRGDESVTANRSSTLRARLALEGNPHPPTLKNQPTTHTPNQHNHANHPDRFAQVTDQMVRANARPDERTHALMLAGHVNLGAADKALGALRSLRAAGAAGALGRAPPGALAGLLRLLADGDRPVDALAVLTAMGEDFCPLPPEALEPDEAGRTLAARWLPGHFGVLAARAAEQRDALEAAGDARSVDGVRIGLGTCAVDDAGAPMALSKMTLRELRAEAVARGLDEGPGAIDVETAKRGELVAPLKAARAALPYAVASRIKALEAARRRGARGAAGKGGRAASAKGLRRVRVETWVDGELKAVREKITRPPLAKFMKAG